MRPRSCAARLRVKAAPAQDVLALNAAAAIYVGGRAASLKEGVAMAREILVAGRALEVVERMRRASHGETS